MKAILIVLVLAFNGYTVQASMIQAWGFNGYGQIGDGTKSSSRLSPVTASVVPGNVGSIAAGQLHSLSVQDGAVFAWGDNSSHQLGDGTNASHTTPSAVPLLTSNVSAVAAGSFRSLAVQSGGVFAWGGQATVPTAVSGLSSGVTLIASGNTHSLAVKDGALYAWGQNQAGQLGNGGYDSALVVPVAVAGLSSNVTAISAANSVSMAIRNGAVYAWGSNSNSLVEPALEPAILTPTAVAGLTDGTTAIAVGLDHALAVRNGNVYAWGANTYGQIGDGTTTFRDTPVQVDPVHLVEIVSVASSSFSSYALAADGSLWVWGYNTTGDLGLGDATHRYTPQHLMPPTGYRFTAIDADSEGDHAVASLAAVPEPTSTLLVAIGAAGMLRRHRRLT